MRVWTPADRERLRENRRLPVRHFAPPRDRLVLTSDDLSPLALAEKLWDDAPGFDGGPAPIRFEVGVRPGPPAGGVPERDLAWTRDDDGWELALGDLLHARIDFAGARVEARVSRWLLSADPALAARYLFEAPAAALLSRRKWQALHAAAVVGPRGALVIRGAPGAGKSTLAAALAERGFSILADESLLVAREDPEDLAAAVRDLTLRDDAARFLGVLDRTRPAFSGGEPKRRIDLFPESAPGARRARLAAVVLLGDRGRTPPALVPLSAEAFAAAFRDGEIPQERDGADPCHVGRAWGVRGGFRLDGARDLAGAVSLLAERVM